MKIALMAGKQAGVVGLLTIRACWHDISAIVSYSEDVTRIAEFFKIPVYNSIHHPSFISVLKKSTLLLSVHGREIVPKDLLKLPAVNVHPYLYTYKGIRPIKQALKDKNYNASVGMHYMTEETDKGQVIIEHRQEVSGSTEKEIYNELYPLYALTILEGLKILENELIWSSGR